jgi:RNA polymerase sigma-70 factor (ECF subfamily)
MVPSDADSHAAATGDVPPHGTDLSLLERARARDAAAWQQLVGLYQPLVTAWCKRDGVNGVDAEDIAQEVFAAAAKALDRFHRDRPGDTFRGWLRAITRNQVLLLFRRNAGRAHAEGGSDAWCHLQELADPFIEGEEESVEIGELCLRALKMVRGEFEEHTWQAFWLTTVEDRRPADLVQELNMTANNIRQAKSRVLRRLRKELGDVLD